MVIIYSRDTDSFVNQVIGYLKEDYIRIGDLDKVILNNLNIDSNEIAFKLSSVFF